MKKVMRFFVLAVVVMGVLSVNPAMAQDKALKSLMSPSERLVMALCQGAPVDEIKGLIATCDDLNTPRDIDGLTVLEAALTCPVKEKAEVLHLLMEKGADPGRPNPKKNGSTVFHSFFPLARSIIKDSGLAEAKAMLAALTAKVTDIDLADPSGQTALHLACRLDSPEFAEILLEKGAKIEAKTSKGNTPLMVAAGSGKPEVVKFLLARGADPKAENAQGKTANGLSSNKEVKALLGEKTGGDAMGGTEKCRAACRKFIGAYELYAMDSSKTETNVNSKDFPAFQKELVAKKYLKEVVQCPEGGELELQNGKITCSKHGKEE